MRAGGRCGRVGTAAAAVLMLLAAGCAGSGDGAADPPPPRLGVQLLQVRPDDTLRRIEVSVTNRSHQVVTVDTLDLRVPGFSGGGVQPKGEPLPHGQRVDLPTPYGDVRCTADGRAQVGRPTVVLLVHTESDPTSRRLVLVPRGSMVLLHRIGAAECLTRRLAGEVSLSFGPHWRRSGHGAVTELRGTLQARLTIDEPRDVTQVAGSVIYELIPELGDRPGAGTGPLAHLAPARPSASIPVLVRRARCDGHARGETKKPYAFLVWLGPPGTAGQAVSPTVSDADKAALRAVCPL